VVHFAGLHSEGLPYQEVYALANDTADQLEAWAAAHTMPLHIEYAAYNPSLATPEALLDIVAPRAHLHVCLDVGHLRVAAEMLGRDEWGMARLLAPHTRSMHLWTTRGREDVRRYHHVPVHPSLNAEGGWIDIPGMLELVLSHAPECGVVFEAHGLYNPAPDWQTEGMVWVRELVARYRA
jgi:sugar phosphate isomerase/epimerase